MNNKTKRCRFVICAAAATRPMAFVTNLSDARIAKYGEDRIGGSRLLIRGGGCTVSRQACFSFEVAEM